MSFYTKQCHSRGNATPPGRQSAKLEISRLSWENEKKRIGSSKRLSVKQGKIRLIQTDTQLKRTHRRTVLAKWDAALWNFHISDEGVCKKGAWYFLRAAALAQRPMHVGVAGSVFGPSNSLQLSNDRCHHNRIKSWVLQVGCTRIRNPLCSSLHIMIDASE